MNSVDSHIDVPLSYCNSDCSCDKNQWEPICGKNGVTYISPCLAGCKSSSGNKNSNSTVSIRFHFVTFLTHDCTTDFMDTYQMFIELRYPIKRFKNRLIYDPCCEGWEINKSPHEILLGTLS